MMNDRSRDQERGVGLPGSPAGWVMVVVAVTVLFMGAVSCSDDPTEPMVDLPQLLPPVLPENVIENIAILYSERVRNVDTWVGEYEKLLLPASEDPSGTGFIFRFQPVDIADGLPPVWGIADEVTAHRGLFQAFADSSILSLSLTITQNSPEDLDPPLEGRDGWKRIRATNVNYRLMFNANDGLEVVGGQADFILKPDDGVWRVADWLDLPRPFAPGPGQSKAVSPATWGSVKTLYHRGPYQPVEVQEPLLSPTRPEYLIENLAIIYNDTLRSAAERQDAYGDLLLAAGGEPPRPDFVFRFQDVDIQGGLPPSWGLAQEIAAHSNLFAAQENGEVYSLELDVTYGDPEPLEPPQTGREDWREILATNVNLRLLFNPNDGIEVEGGQAEFQLAPFDDRWYIAGWTDLPRPLAGTGLSAVEPATWGSIKHQFRR
jgi:hypothetical protein